MAHKRLRDVEADGSERSEFRTICELCLDDNRCGAGMARAGRCIDHDSSYGKGRPSDTILLLRKPTPYKRNVALACSLFFRGACTRGLECPYRHGMPDRNINVYRDVPVTIRVLEKSAETPSLTPPEDESIRTLYIRGVASRIFQQQQLKDLFYTYGKLDSIQTIPANFCAFITYETREGAEKAADALANRLVVNDTPLQVSWDLSM